MSAGPRAAAPPGPPVGPTRAAGGRGLATSGSGPSPRGLYPPGGQRRPGPRSSEVPRPPVFISTPRCLSPLGRNSKEFTLDFSVKTR
ncbi:hypothetical protein VULLAG_LOCUS2469 [Vulpes lagopus]